MERGVAAALVLRDRKMHHLDSDQPCPYSEGMYQCSSKQIQRKYRQCRSGSSPQRHCSTSACSPHSCFFQKHLCLIVCVGSIVGSAPSSPHIPFIQEENVYRSARAIPVFTSASL